MDREKAQEILKAYGRPSFKVGENNIVFARQTEENLSEIETKTNPHEIYNIHSFSRNDCRGYFWFVSNLGVERICT